MNDKTERFLDRATTGLASDPELRLDVQAELRSHIEDKIAELGGDEQADEAVASLGEVVELAEEVSQANQRRLGWRNLARRALRFGLVPLSIVCVLFFSNVRGSLGVLHLQQLLGGDSFVHVPYFGEPGLPKRRSVEEETVLHGDPTRQGADKYRTLWERNPTNRVYYADYITHLLAATPRVGSVYPEHELPERRQKLLNELAEAQTVDPQNGRYPLLAAMARADAAAGVQTAKAVDGETPVYAFEIRDRAALDTAMQELLAALALPEFHCYYKEMLAERLDLMPPPTSLVLAMQRVAVSAGTLLTDLSHVRDAARYAIAYSQLLAKEGHRAKALSFLNVPESLARRTTEDSFTLIELLVSRALTGIAQETVPKALREAGHEAEADAAHKRLAAIRSPMQKWYDSRHVGESETAELLSRRGGWLASMLLPALGGQNVADLETRLVAGRFLEFTVLAQGLVAALQIILLVAMLICLVISLRWRFALGSQAAPLLLLPSWRDMVRYVILGIVLPFAAFLAWTRWVPFSGHAYGLKYAGHRALAELLALAFSLLLVPAWLAARDFRRRCAELELPAPPRIHWTIRIWFPVVALVLAIVFLVPVGSSLLRTSATVAASSGGVIGLAVLVVAVWSLFVSRGQARTVGTLSRSLIPVFAVAILMLSFAATPLLRLRERQLLQADTILGATDDEPGFTRIESELTGRLREATLKAMAENPMSGGEGRAE